MVFSGAKRNYDVHQWLETTNITSAENLLTYFAIYDMLCCILGKHIKIEFVDIVYFTAR